MKLRTKLSLTFAVIVMLTVLFISLLANVFVNNEFKKYITRQQEQKAQEIVSDISAQYNTRALGWDMHTIHNIGMNALYDGYIIKLMNTREAVFWDAEECDMSACMQVMSDISQRMQSRYPQISGEITSRDFPLTLNGTLIGTANISYYGPYFLSDNDFQFLDTLNVVLAIIGISSLVLSVVSGMFLAKRISDPVSKAAEAARRMSQGDYAARINGKNDTIELVELVDSVNLLSQSLSHQESLRKQLTADVAHELRTPITSIQTHLEAMVEGMWEPTPERLASCHDEAVRIGAIVKDLEGLARVDNENIGLDKKPVDLSCILDKAADSFEMEIENNRLSVAISGSAQNVWADEDKIRQVAVNLLSNAIKYTPQGGRIDVVISQTEEHAEFAISDNGIGIPEEELPFIFERFYRADKSRNRKTGGSGIGLAVVKAIVTAHGGKVHVESRLKYGSCFRVMLPLRVAE